MGVNMKKIGKMVLCDDEYDKRCIVIYDNLEVRSYQTSNKHLNTFSRQTHKDYDDLVKDEQICKYSKYKFDELENNVNIKYNDYFRKVKELYFRMISSTGINILLQLMVKTFEIGTITLVSFAFNIYLSLTTLITFYPKFRKTQKQCKIKGNKKLLVYSILLFLISLANLIEVHTHDIKNIPYYINNYNSSIDDNHIFNLDSKDEYSKKVDVILDDIEKNPYLSQKEKSTFVQTEEFLRNHNSIDLDALYKKCMVLDAQKYAFDTPLNIPVYIEDIDLIQYSEVEMIDEKEVLTHEYSHLFGSLENELLDEGVAQIITRDVLKKQNEFLLKHEVGARYVLSLIGEDLYTAYLTKNDDLIVESLKKVCKDENESFKVIETIESYIRGEITDEEILVDLKSMVKDEYAINLDYIYNTFKNIPKNSIPYDKKKNLRCL